MGTDETQICGGGENCRAKDAKWAKENQTQQFCLLQKMFTVK
jgi:hypothetical protein